MSAVFLNFEALRMRIIDLVLLTASLAFSSLTLQSDFQSFAIAIGGSVSGAMVLSYFRRAQKRGEALFQILCSTVSGLIVGSAIQEYFADVALKFSLLIYFLSGLLSLLVLRALYNATERNAAEAIKGFLQRLLGLQLPDERRTPADEGRLVTFERTEQPNSKNKRQKEGEK